MNDGNQAAHDPYYNLPSRRMGRQWIQIKRAVRMTANSIVWKVLWKIGLAVTISKWRCRTNRYPKFMNGRCMYCGNNH